MRGGAVRFVLADRYQGPFFKPAIPRWEVPLGPGLLYGCHPVILGFDWQWLELVSPKSGKPEPLICTGT